jgi:hypothetical protein
VKNSAARCFQPDAAAGEAPEIGRNPGEDQDRASPKPCQLTEKGPCDAPHAAGSSPLRWPEIAPKRVTTGPNPKFQIAGKWRSTPNFLAKPNARRAPVSLSDQILASSSRTTLPAPHQDPNDPPIISGSFSPEEKSPRRNDDIAASHPRAKVRAASNRDRVPCLRRDSPNFSLIRRITVSSSYPSSAKRSARLANS